ncbi:18082_t:CDS:2 [Racocetra fulgida]|uniref:18082_t:CDS:1 n=1 Tax=Racocetra fulgida TaxID=60492 RepID=A0A9N8WSK0_9GLOM|nr:18082_t:CDS:2 [Racocetra fulgida]
MVPNKVLRLFSKVMNLSTVYMHLIDSSKQENAIDHSYIRKPYKVEWTKQHETKESNTYISPRPPLKIGDLDPSANWRRHQSTPLLVDPRRLATYDHKRNNSDGGEWNYHKQTPSDRKDDVYSEREQFANEVLKKNKPKIYYQQSEPILPIKNTNANAKPILNTNAKPILNTNTKPIANSDAKPILNANKNAKLIENANEKTIKDSNPIVDSKHASYSQISKHASYSQISHQSNSILQDSKKPIKFGSWSSGNDDIDMFILETQLSSPSRFDYLEWIPFDRFKGVQFIGSGGYGNVYQAIWLDGPREKWDDTTARYVSIAIGLMRLHKKDLIHRNLHSGNVFMTSSMTLLGDIKLPILFKDNLPINDGVYGVLPYMAPEILRNQQFTKDSDIYSFGIIMWELAFGKKPFSNRAHNLHLATDICDGIHPEFDSEIPEYYTSLIKRCLDLDPLARPDAEQLYRTLGEWLCMINVPDSDIAKQFNEAGENQNLSNYKPSLNDIHPEAVYTSRRYKFESLELPNIIFTKTNERRERLAVRQYMANETKLCNIKLEMIRAENSVIAAEIYDILRYL